VLRKRSMSGWVFLTSRILPWSRPRPPRRLPHRPQEAGPGAARRLDGDREATVRAAATGLRSPRHTQTYRRGDLRNRQSPTYPILAVETMSLDFLRMGLSCRTKLEPEIGEGAISERPASVELIGRILEVDAHLVLTGIVAMRLTPTAVAYPSGLFDCGSPGHTPTSYWARRAFLWECYQSRNPHTTYLGSNRRESAKEEVLWTRSIRRWRR